MDEAFHQLVLVQELSHALQVFVHALPGFVEFGHPKYCNSATEVTESTESTEQQTKTSRSHR
jgi:hypothetical protein